MNSNQQRSALMRFSMLMRHSVCRVAFVVLTIGLVFSSPAVGQDRERKLLNLVVYMQGASVRSNAPIVLDCTLEYQKMQLLEGDLRLVIKELDHQIMEFWVNDLVLPGGNYQFRMVLPPVSGSHFNGIDLYPTFVTESGNIEMEDVSLIVPSQQERAGMVAFCSDSISVKDNTIRVLEEALDLNRFNPVQKRDRTLNQSVQNKVMTVYPGRIAPADLPETAIRCCGFDILVVVNDAWGKLKQKQLDMIDEWVSAGGRLCVVPGGRMSAAHMDYLNLLVRARNDAEPFLAEDTGELAPRTYANQGVELVRRGLGRVAIFDPKYPFTVDQSAAPSPVMIETSRFLWNVRAGQQFSEAKWTALSEQNDNAINQYGAQSNDYKVANDLTVHKNWGVGSILRRVMPEDVQLVPFGLVGAILFCYVVAIGPGDYWFLGLLKRRKLTWVLFPAVTLLFTMFTVWISNHYMSATSPGRELVIADLVEGGRVARVNRLGVIFTGSQQTIEREFKDEIRMGIDHHSFSMGVNGFGGRGYASSSGSYVQPIYSGRFPGNYKTTQYVAQWSPQMYRTFEIAPDMKSPFGDSDFNWDYPIGDGRTSNGRGRLQTQLSRLGTKLPEGTTMLGAFVYCGDQSYAILGSDREIFPHNSNQRVYYPGTANLVLTNPLEELCRRRDVGLFNVVSRIAPTGAANFEDLTLLDQTDSEEWLLVVVLESESEIQIFRRAYHGMPRKPDAK